MDVKLLILGIGNTLRRDDGIGIYLIEELRKFVERPDVKIYEIGIETWRILPIIKEEKCENILIIDTINLNSLIPGAVYIARNPKILEICTLSLHEKHYLVEIFLEKLTFLRNIYIFGIEPYDITWGLELSNYLEEKFDEIFNKLLNLCNLI
ncbi:MAG: hydrogenase maturation protease, partial [bacterium]|nr:hydrogenase maturation protease [bacterium]MDW8163965.1 hydrogenase maturation protease [Candidatus Omnitrophota bacterium]